MLHDRGGRDIGELRKQGAAGDTNDILEMFELCVSNKCFGDSVTETNRYPE
jgi:hypothetical protein